MYNFIESFVFFTFPVEKVLLVYGIFYLIIFGIFLGLFLIPFKPRLIEELANNPNSERKHPETGVERTSTAEYKASDFGFFTKLNPGQVKIIEQGGRFIKCIMRYDDHAFQGERPSGKQYSPSNSEYWEVQKTGIRESDSHPIPIRHLFTWWALLFFPVWPIRFLWWLWKRWVYLITGYVFTGIYPFRKVRTYPIERFKKIKDENGVEKLDRIEDYSDHYRVADFQYPVTVPEADTQDKIPVQVKVDFVARVINPYLTAYQTDDWASRLSASIGDAVTHFTRPRPIQRVLSAESEDTVRELSDEIMEIGQPPKKGRVLSTNILQFGIETVSALIYDISPTNEDDARRLGELARARVERDAERARAEGRAANIEKQAEAAKKHGPFGLAVIAGERDVRSAQAVAESKNKQAILMVGSGGSTDPIQVAMLAAIKNLNETPAEETSEKKDA